ncbi:hypothetical protein GCM10025876_15610 [Demequina litorisediminis]|uniref:UDP-glucose 4-epimerase n=1 Tax=Demequina litorisediminis TaxID=1849022 RepID=A0ABQ6IDW2_9MICO|nr:hypothetical protein GCM10025876_15610 [Demequina litorisediminis]
MVTGGAGYIGSHVVRALTDGGIDAVVLDDLSSGFESFIPEGVPFVKASILETEKVRAALVEHGVQGVIHCAGYKYAGESVKLPIHTYRQNVEGTACLLEAMADAGVTQARVLLVRWRLRHPGRRGRQRDHPHHAGVALRRVQGSSASGSSATR